MARADLRDAAMLDQCAVNLRHGEIGRKLINCCLRIIYINVIRTIVVDNFLMLGLSVTYKCNRHYSN